MGLLKDCGVEWVYHFTPLHYVPFISRSKKILSKPSLKKEGFASSHFRSMSASHDVQRGFGQYSHLTLDSSPRILKAKLSAGFPHVGLRVPVDAIDEKVEFSLCRFNVAMTRFLRRDGKQGFPQSATNGRYYEDLQIPVARTAQDKTAMLKAFLGTQTMIEVLVHGDLQVPDDSLIECYDSQDVTVVKKILSRTENQWQVDSKDPPGPYPNSTQYRSSVEKFIETALSDPTWHGDGLEFDRV